MAKRRRDLRIEYMRLDAIQRDPENPKDHDLGALAESLGRFGFVAPMGLNEGTRTLLWGHGRLDRLEQSMAGGGSPPEGIQVDPDDGMWLAPVVRGVRMNPDEGQAYVVADNRLVELGGWNEPQLADRLVRMLQQDGKGLRGTGFDAEDVSVLLANLSQTRPGDEPPDLSKIDRYYEKWQAQVGELWEIPSLMLPGASHRLLVDDCRSAENLARMFGEARAHLLFTSPPYWIGKDWEKERSEAEIDAFVAACAAAWATVVQRRHGRIVINTESSSSIHLHEKGRPLERVLLLPKWQIEFRKQHWLIRHIRIWAKLGPVPGRSKKQDPVDQYWEHLAEFADPELEDRDIEEDWEYIGAFYDPDEAQRGQLRASTRWAFKGVWSDIAGGRSAEGRHNAAFPVELPRRHILLYSARGEIVVDPMVGSGTTMAAAEQLGRIGYGIEIDPRFASVTLERMAEMGLQPVRIGTGEKETA